MVKTNLKLTGLNNTKLRHFWAQIVSWAPIHARKNVYSLGPWSRLFTWPNHLSHAFLHLSVILSTFSLSLVFSFLTWSLSVWPHAHPHIFISVTSSFFTWELVTGTVSIPYNIAININNMKCTLEYVNELVVLQTRAKGWRLVHWFSWVKLNMVGARWDIFFGVSCI